ncbi:hypothetical protein CLOP_g8838 [Closterium sp. NIES-67]|nr:hypothetical protein CLOP_g8838 [Closterium sp. NIES-67]
MHDRSIFEAPRARIPRPSPRCIINSRCAQWLSLLALLLLLRPNSSQGEDVANCDSLGSILPSSRLHFGFPDSLCGNWWKEYVTLHNGMREESRSRQAQAQAQASGEVPATATVTAATAATAAATAAAAPPSTSPLSSPPLSSSSPPPLRFLTYEVLFGCGGLGDALIGLAAAFTVALLDGRALILNHPCLPQAFEPAHVDWRLTDDVPMEPSRKYTYVPPVDAGAGSTTSIGSEAQPGPPDAAVQAGEVLRLNLKNRDVDLQPLFARLAPAANILLRWNRGVLTRLFLEAYNADREGEGGTGKGGVGEGAGRAGEGESGMRGSREWALRLRALGLRLPLATGCFLRFLLRPKPEVWQLIRPFDQQLRGDRTVCDWPAHPVRGQGSVGGGGEGMPLSLSEERVREMVEEVKPTLECAKRVQEWYVPSTLSIKWLLLCNSMQVKHAIREKYPDKVVTTDFTPRHANSMDAAHTTGQSPSSNADAPFQELIAEWLLLASSHFFVIPNSGFSRTALLYSMHPAGSAFMPPDNCFPEAPVNLTWLGTTWSRI